MNRRRPRYTVVAAALAVVLALAGTGSIAHANNNKVGPTDLRPSAVKAKHIDKKAVKTRHLAKGSVRTGKIAKGAVRTGKLAPGAVRTGKLADGAVTSSKLRAAGVTTSKLANGSVTGPKLGAGSVTGPKLANGSITNSKLQDRSVTASKLANGSVTGPKLAAGSVTGPKLAAGSVTADKLAPGAGGSELRVFSADADAYAAGAAVKVPLPGVTEEQVRTSQWSASIVRQTITSAHSDRLIDPRTMTIVWSGGTAWAELYPDTHTRSNIVEIRIEQLLPTRTTQTSVEPFIY